MRHHSSVFVLVTGLLLLGLAGCRGDSTKPSSEASPIAPTVQAEVEKDQPPAGEIQDRAVPRLAPGRAAPPKIPTPQAITPGVAAGALPPLDILPGEFAIMTLRSRTFLTAVGGGGRTTDVIHTDATRPSSWERFMLWLVDSRLRQYAVRTYAGNFLTAVGGGGRIDDVLHSDARQVQSWEKFWLRAGLHGWNNTIQTVNGNYLTAVGGGGKTTDAIHSDAVKADMWESFKVLKCGDLGSGYQYAIGAPNGALFAVGGGGRLAPAIGVLDDYNQRPIPYDDNWQKFRLLRQGDGSYALQTLDGHYVTAVNGGGLAHGTTVADNLQTNRTQVQAWETFRLVDQGDCWYTIQTVSGSYLGKSSAAPGAYYGAFSTAISDINYAIKFRLTMYF